MTELYQYVVETGWAKPAFYFSHEKAERITILLKETPLVNDKARSNQVRAQIVLLQTEALLDTFKGNLETRVWDQESWRGEVKIRGSFINVILEVEAMIGYKAKVN